MQSASLIYDVAAAGAWNMAVDEALLEDAASGRAAVRFYTWQVPTLSLGYFQAWADRLQAEWPDAYDVVRRITGGGAIVHHHELTYSIATPCDRRQRGCHQQLYEAAHQSLIDELARWNVAGKLCDNAEAQQSSHHTPAGEPFLCFARRTAGDVLLEGYKIAGSAQRRRRAALLQHGSLLLAASPHAAELPGVAQLANVEIDPAAFAQGWSRRLADRLGWSLQQVEANGGVQKRAQLLHDKTFAHASWTASR